MAIPTSYERLDYGSTDGSQWGGSSADKLGFYGNTPVIQRAYTSAVHATAGITTSADFGATQLAAVQEIQKTLIGLGIWATA
jgi:hypothetical protein